MNKLYLVALGLLLGTSVAQAQYVFTDTNLGPYTQDFNTLTGNQTFTNGTTLPGVYATFTFDTAPTVEQAASAFGPIPANDGSNTAAFWYHFGYAGSTDRALGGIASTTVANGIGYIGIRLKNSSSKVIKNLEVQYAMEQWYNSGNNGAAMVKFHYQRSASAITSNITGTWTPLTTLDVQAPSTTTVIAPRDGNSSTNRRVMKATLQDINLAVGEEIMLRWSYTFNTGTNGNGLSMDDVVISPQTNVFYSATSGDLDKNNSWGTSTDGSGTRPSDFTSANQTFYVQGTATANRVQQGNAWIVSGANSKIIVGNGVTPSRLLIDNSNKTVEGIIEVAAGSTLEIQRTDLKNVKLGYLDPTSTVIFSGNGLAHTIPATSYGNLTLADGGAKTLGGAVLVSGQVNLNSNTNLTLGNYDATILRGGGLSNYGSSAFVVTNGTGRLRQAVQNSGVDVVYPVGSSATSYTPAYLQQPNSTTARNEDVFGVRVQNGIYSRYDANDNAQGTAISASQGVDKTWLISEEVKGNANVTMGLQWNTADEATGSPAFDRTKAYVGHYLTSPQPYFDRVAATAATAGSITGSYRMSRSGITSFSPFVVSSRNGGPLPVQLVSFSAQRSGTGVVSSWETAQELNNRHFVVERSRTGQDFEAIGTVAGHGTSNNAHRYQYTDTQAPAAVTYYRLRQVDTDGAEAFSAVVAVNGTGEAALAWVQPNPGTGLYQLVVQQPGSVIQAEVLSVIGSRVQTVGADGRIDLQQQPSGIYLVRYRTAQGPKTLRLLKE
ncbi:T9SS type A sorting domain-containing protein [Hymenobacter rigui]|uniref:T9SS C-terminal target domain-containing protein n=1 Tax=Hymenobacter rigui TaxID=334424 RepID=A0A3R9VBT0_9BACT|nr:T9SS type A sorting domain-containing protein [Hymenobacter rigui]RSK50881.1 T9SS C-terminal target domain-containing protein [Hymenobacter rigui]